MNLPNARTADIIEQEADKELLIYDLRTNKAYTLNETSKKIYQSCDGKSTFGDVQNRYKYTADLIHFTLQELAANNLVENYHGDHFSGLSRREALKRVGLAAAVSLPVVSAFMIPTAAHAASACTTGTAADGGSGAGQACFCRAGIAPSTACGTGDGSSGARNTFCKPGCTCTSNATPSMACQQGIACRGVCG